jgi:hypothetical protein
MLARSLTILLLGGEAHQLAIVGASGMVDVVVFRTLQISLHQRRGRTERALPHEQAEVFRRVGELPRTWPPGGSELGGHRTDTDRFRSSSIRNSQPRTEPMTTYV